MDFPFDGLRNHNLRGFAGDSDLFGEFNPSTDGCLASLRNQNLLRCFADLSFAGEAEAFSTANVGRGVSPEEKFSTLIVFPDCLGGGDGESTAKRAISRTGWACFDPEN